MAARAISRHIGVFPYVIVHAVVDDALSPDFPLGDAVEVFVRREDTERFIEEVRVDESVLIVAPRDPLSHQLRHRRASSRRGVVPRPHGSADSEAEAASMLAKELAAGRDEPTMEKCKAAALERYEFESERS